MLNGTLEANIFPFLWLHGESEAVLREYMSAIWNANIRAVCLESRPHPDFLGDGWWHDLDILLDEARKCGMKIWLLDDSHFPTGFANGALQNVEPELCRQFLTRAVIEGEDISELPACAPDWKPGRCEGNLQFTRTFDDDVVISVTRRRGQAGPQTVVCYLTRNRGPHRTYINMADERSVRVLIDTVYEAHYARYAADFGKTIAGFFSDEPELGNDHLYEYGKRLWELDDLPWSSTVEAALRKRWGESFTQMLPLLWDEDGAAAASARYDYMDVLTAEVKHCFSEQIGDWCHAHGVEYIGHLIEDNNQHTRTGSSLGHYFRGLAGQDMAGIDDIGNQVMPQGEWNGSSGPWNDYRDGEFYHYVLGKLGSSLAAIDPRKKGRALCEIFGNYGWEEGVKLEKYLIDHFLVRGINRFVPHAFSPKEFPDPDCPPHFYAHGHNPQYRHFATLMAYTSRLCTLFDGGAHAAPVAILYNASAEWTGEYLDLQKPAIPLMDHQIDYDIIPEDVFSEPEVYHTKLGEQLQVNAQHYKLLLVPGAQYITQPTAQALETLRKSGCHVWFVQRRPEGLCDSAETHDWEQFPVVPLAKLAENAKAVIGNRLQLVPENSRIRCLHYNYEGDIYFLVNEGTHLWRGTVYLPSSGSWCVYDAWENRLETLEQSGNAVQAEITPGKSLCIVPKPDTATLHPRIELTAYQKADLSTGWVRSQCESIRYPNFTGAAQIDLPDHLAEEQPAFSGFVRYEKQLYVREPFMSCLLIVEDAAEGVEVFVNGRSLGIQISSPFQYELGKDLQQGENSIRIEVATTLERAMAETVNAARQEYGLAACVPRGESGICGMVWLCTRSNG